MFLVQFSIKLNKLFIKFWECLDNKCAIIYTKNCSPNNEENAIFFPETFAKKFKKKTLHFLHEAANVYDKSFFFSFNFLTFSRNISALLCLPVTATPTQSSDD